MKTPVEIIDKSYHFKGPNYVMRDNIERFFGVFELSAYSDLSGFFVGPWGKRILEIKEEQYVAYPQEIMDTYETSLQNNIKDDLTFPYEDRFRDLYFSSGNKDEDHYQDFREVVLGPSQNLSCDEAFVWNATRHLSGFNPPKWTALMRSMGFIGAIDYGTRTIHPNEPYQAVFFDPGSIQPLEFIHNKNTKYTDYYSTSERDDTRRKFYDWARGKGGMSSVETWINRDVSYLKVIQDTIVKGIRDKDYDTDLYAAWRITNNLESTLHNIFRVFGWMTSHPQLIEPSFLEEKKREVRNVVQDTSNLINDLVEQTRSRGISSGAQDKINGIFNRLNLMIKTLR
jgi:hypothetical protein